MTVGAAAFAWTSAYRLSAALPGGDTIVVNLTFWAVAVVLGAVVVRLARARPSKLAQARPRPPRVPLSAGSSHSY